MRGEGSKTPAHAESQSVAAPRLHQWLENCLPPLQDTAGQPVRVFCAIWNLHGKQAPKDLHPWLVRSPLHHVYVVGTCECERSIERSLLWSSKARWEKQVHEHLGNDYLMLAAENMSAVHIMVFLHRDLWPYCWNIQSCHVATGIGNMIGNKGCTKVGFCLGRTSFLFMNAHLAAHAHKMQERTQSLHRILLDSPLRQRIGNSVFAAEGVHESFDRVFFMGDLNIRLDANRKDIISWIDAKDLAKCQETDQLRSLLKTRSPLAGFWPAFSEAEIGFAPTYKFDPGTDAYDSKKLRAPAWTDRILWRRDEHITARSYCSVPSMRASDHRPVFAQFDVAVDLAGWAGPDGPPASRSSVCSLQ